ncbi:putative beta-ig-h3 fasciclin [Diplodia seriata]|uniref:Putative beta-ig-h3 fasciclin n=1 Tax=Diplodia seriata TaxID=420778 RepID=A0A0G2EEE7_9PEZI|nr:putative beta-ig-h3 fasciclin [Diplodia seriata]
MLKHITLAALASTALAQTTQDLNATLSGIPELSNLTTYLGLVPEVLSSLSGANNITILAPSNDAFNQLMNTSLGTALTQDPGLIQAVLTYHVLNGTYNSSQITEDSQFVPTLLTDPAYANVTGGQRVEVEEEDDNVVFYSGLLQNATVTRADVNFTGGIIHIVDNLLTLPANVSSTALAANLTALVGALTNASLVDAVDTTPDVTIFAPSNDAFAAVGSVLANASAAELAAVLGYHVVNGTAGALYSADLVAANRNGSNQTSTVQLTALGGGELTIRVLDDGDVFVNGAKVIVPDLLVANGVLHVIDSVLNPSNSTAAPSDDENENNNDDNNNDDDDGDVQFTGAISATDVPFTSDAPTPTTTIDVAATGAGGGAATGTARG